MLLTNDKVIPISKTLYTIDEKDDIEVATMTGIKSLSAKDAAGPQPIKYAEHISTIQNNPESNVDMEQQYKNVKRKAKEEENEAQVDKVTKAKKFSLTVELPLFLNMFVTMLSGPVISNMLINRTCRHTFGYNETICSELQSSGVREIQNIENESQSVTAMVLMVKSVQEGLLPAIVSLFLGVWSNTHGRKPLITWPLLGYSLTHIFIAVYSYVGQLNPWWFLVTSIPYSLSGGTSALYAGSFCYINDITTTEDRSFRLSILGLAVFVGAILGNFLGAYGVAVLGTPGLLLLAAIFGVAAHLYAILWIKESVVGAVPGSLRSIFDISLVKQVLDTCFKQRPKFERAVMVLLIGCGTANIFAEVGAGSISYLYVRQKLSWDIQDYSTFSTVTTLAMGVPLVMVIRRVTKDDIITSMLAFAGGAVEMALKCVATASTSWIMYLSNSTPIIRGLCSALFRSAISKRLDVDETTQVFSLMSALESTAPVLSSVMYSSVYSVTITTFPEAAYVMTITIYAGLFCIMIVTRYLMKKFPVQQRSTES